jgi:hypothetical protein
MAQLKVKVKLTLVQAIKSQKGSRCIALLYINLGAKLGGWSTPRPGRFTPWKKYPVPIVQEAGWAPGTVWTGAEHLAPTGIPSAYRSARSESLHRLSLPSRPGPFHYQGFTIILRHTTLCKTLLDGWSARRRYLCRTTYNTHKRQTCMPPAGFEPTFPASERR